VCSGGVCGTTGGSIILVVLLCGVVDVLPLDVWVGGLLVSCCRLVVVSSLTLFTYSVYCVWFGARLEGSRLLEYNE
jgi:hypothetical protein